MVAGSRSPVTALSASQSNGLAAPPNAQVCRAWYRAPHATTCWASGTCAGGNWEGKMSSNDLLNSIWTLWAACSSLACNSPIWVRAAVSSASVAFSAHCGAARASGAIIWRGQDLQALHTSGHTPKQCLPVVDLQ